GPDTPVMVTDVTRKMPVVTRVSGRERAQAVRGQEGPCDGFKRSGRLFRIGKPVRECNDLVRADGRVDRVDAVIEAAILLIPELPERLLCRFNRNRGNDPHGLRFVERLDPEGVYLHGFSFAGGKG